MGDRELMPQLHLPGCRTIYLVTTYVFTFTTIPLQFILATEWDSPYRDLVEIVGIRHSHCVIFTTSAQKSHDAHTTSLWVPYDYLKSLRSSFWPNDYLKSIVDLTISVQCSYRDHAIYVSTGLRFIQISYSAELNKIVEATMLVNPYDDRRVS